MAVWIRVKSREQFERVIQSNALFADCIIMDYAVASEEELYKRLDDFRKENRKLYYQLPDVLRNPNAEEYMELAQYYDGIVIKNLDELGMIQSWGLTEQEKTVLKKNVPEDFDIIGDAFLYAYNEPALNFYRGLVPKMKFILSDELNKEEIKALTKALPAEDFILKVYGHQAVMVTAQCLNKNYGRCIKQKNSKTGPNPAILFKDETGEEYISLSYCGKCYSIIYKGEAGCIYSKAADKYEHLLMDFTVESGKETDYILKNIKSLTYNGGHFDKGVE